MGGGPRLQGATWIGGTADASRLTLRVTDLEGTVLETISLAPVT